MAALDGMFATVMTAEEYLSWKPLFLEYLYSEP
jgi:hypothetical protein